MMDLLRKVKRRSESEAVKLVNLSARAISLRRGLQLTTHHPWENPRVQRICERVFRR